MLSVRRELERIFEGALRADAEPGEDVTAEVDALLVEPVEGNGVTHHLRRDGTLWQPREYLAHRSIYHLKEGDPRRLNLGPAAIRFYDEHVEANAVHEQIIRRGVLAPMLAAEPKLAAQVVFGIRASKMLGDRFADRLLGCWHNDASSLRRPLTDIAADVH